MSGSFIGRLGAAGAIAYGVMEIVGDSLSSTTDSTQSPQQIAAYFAAHAPTTSTWVGIYIETLGAFAFLIFGAYLWSVGRDRKEGRLLSILALSGGIVQTAVILAGEPPKIEAFFRASQGMDPQVVAAMLDLNNASFFLGFMPQALARRRSGRPGDPDRPLPGMAGLGRPRCGDRPPGSDRGAGGFEPPRSGQPGLLHLAGGDRRCAPVARHRAGIPALSNLPASV